MSIETPPPTLLSPVGAACLFRKKIVQTLVEYKTVLSPIRKIGCTLLEDARHDFLEYFKRLCYTT